MNIEKVLEMANAAGVFEDRILAARDYLMECPDDKRTCDLLRILGFGESGYGNHRASLPHIPGEYENLKDLVPAAMVQTLIAFAGGSDK